jgi:tRNA A-37 threonylcarbamoyl transferase component Bud32
MYGIEGLLAGRTLIDRYLVRDVIGRGGMGAVYRAHDQRLGREVAVKVVTLTAPDQSAHDRLMARFHREARAAARLHHPNVVAVYDFGRDADLGLDFLVMELLRGEDLAARISRAGPPSVALAVEVLRQAASGLAAGHRAGLIHRDVKPGNLFIEPRDDGGDPRVKVLDFGIAEIAAADDATVTHLTVTGRSPYSPAFAAPEQLRGESRLTAAVDVFSLGAVGYYLITGHRAFTATDPREMVVEVSRSAAALREREPAVPPALHDVIRRALAPHPDDRYPDASALASALEAAVNGPLRGRPPASAGFPAHPEPPRRGGPVVRFLHAAGSFILTASSLAIFAAAWSLVITGFGEGDLLRVYGGAAASVVATPLALHRVLRRRGSFRLAVFASIVGSAAAVVLLSGGESVEAVLATMFIAQLLLAGGAELLTRRDPAAAEGRVF